MADPSPTMKTAREIALLIVTPAIRPDGTVEVGEMMVLLETVVALSLLAAANSRPLNDRARWACGMMDGLQDGVSRRIMMTEGKPYD